MKAVSGKELCSILERLGWTLIRTRGSHRRYEKTGFPPITVPVHGNRTLDRGLQKAIMKATGITEDDL